MISIHPARCFSFAFALMAANLAPVSPAMPQAAMPAPEVIRIKPRDAVNPPVVERQDAAEPPAELAALPAVEPLRETRPDGAPSYLAGAMQPAQAAIASNAERSPPKRTAKTASGSSGPKTTSTNSESSCALFGSTNCASGN